MSFFTSFTKTPNSYALLADHTKVPVVGKRDARFLINGKVIQVSGCLFILSLSSPLYSTQHYCKYAGCAFIADNEECTLTFPEFIVNVDNSKDCLISIQPVLPTSAIDFNAVYINNSSTKRVHFARHVSIHPCDCVNSSSAKHCPLSEHQLYCYLGNRSLHSFKEIEAIAQENPTIVNTGEIPVENGDMAKIQGSQRSNEPVEPPPTTFNTMHADIRYGDSTAPGGIKYILILVN
eukprot:10894687-Ditylum_brightwellii.AAC.1